MSFPESELAFVYKRKDPKTILSLALKNMINLIKKRSQDFSTH